MSFDRSRRDDSFDTLLAPVLHSVKGARDLVTTAWAHWRLGDDFDARLIVSELVTNSVLASQKAGMEEKILVRCRLVAGAPVIEVKDMVSEPLRFLTTQDQISEGGRGLPLVFQLCAYWEVTREATGGKVIRIELARAA